ncbi:hypothetical protein GCM10010497_46210 [Streptomyces cinereoruber]|uniref:Uncharacterized protein n=1 Tax=Streptomyces cinereoruber TaxID=67260 RepID=A0AAV4KN32_9ACTN|nr:hypothetical protein [Streptomyces cinereoruber]MBB4160090.1 hypothetical protein [Streptomyces cinereoruber]MBY8818300.1 hypothetical protein [Streptomyces cinereoruber]NIH61028.1 hypothetical protein [Streptomyces cinereoruber]GGR38049.1 hypothetical protein GCM10010497_46210 [Streptomyces cinereoruber]
MTHATQPPPPRTGPTVLRPDCQFDEHKWCKPGAVYVGTTEVFPAKRCDCPCHKGAES